TTIAPARANVHCLHGQRAGRRFRFAPERSRLAAEGADLATYVNKDNNFELAEPTSRTCPHCGAHARLLPVATPSFEELIRSKPRRTGLVLRCTACNEPRFARLSVRRLGEDRIELSSTLV